MDNCPICSQDYTAIYRSFSVCEKHQKWLVTRCMGCKTVVFSDCAGVCLACSGDENFRIVDLEIDDAINTVSRETD